MKFPSEIILRYVRESKDDFETFGKVTYSLKMKRQSADLISSMDIEFLRELSVRDKEFIDCMCRMNSFHVQGMQKKDVVDSKSDDSLMALKELMCEAIEGTITEDTWKRSIVLTNISVSSEILSYIDSEKYAGLNYVIRDQLEMRSCITFDEYLEFCKGMQRVSGEMKCCGYKENDLFAAAAFIGYLPERKSRMRLAAVDETSFVNGILKEIGQNIIPDDEQKDAMTLDCKNLLLVACAGSGKTTSLAGKLKYLIVRKKVPQDRILVTSFTNMAVKDLKDTINGKMHLYPKIGTFHSIARHSFAEEETNIENFPEGKVKYLITRMSNKDDQKYDPRFFRRLMMFFLLGFADRRVINHGNSCSLHDIDSKEEMELKINFNSMCIANRAMRCRSIIGEMHHDQYETAVANAMYLGGIEYQYNRTEKLKDGTEITPMFTLWDGSVLECRHPFEGSKGLAEICRRNGKRYREFIYPILVSECAENLYKSIGKRVGPSIHDVFKKLLSTDEREYLSIFSSLVTNFISLFKINRCSLTDYPRLMRNTFDLRSTLFLQMVRDIHDEYSELLRNERKSDFDDLIVNACSSLERMRDLGKKLNYDYIMVDEYQDIAAHRADLIDLIAEVSDAHLVVVGDDWQSIYSFAGSRTGYFLEFKERHEGTEVRTITKTYRNSKELIDIAGGFVLRNPTQMVKDLRSDKHMTDPIRVVYYENSIDEWKCLCEAIECIIARMVRDYDNPGRILVITRYTFEIRNIRKSGYFTGDGDRLVSNDFPYADITILTAHRSKGLTYDRVIIASAVDDEYGFPSKVMDDPVLGMLRKRDDSMPFAEERRLFYVSLTRTSNEVYIVAPIQGRSVFVKELCETYRIKRCSELESSDVSEMMPSDTEPDEHIPVTEEGIVCPLHMVTVDSGKTYYLSCGKVQRDYNLTEDKLGFIRTLECALCSAGEWAIVAEDDLAYSVIQRCRLPYGMRIVRDCESDDVISITSSARDPGISTRRVRIALWNDRADQT